jgi:hypothetical protein
MVACGTKDMRADKNGGSAARLACCHKAQLGDIELLTSVNGKGGGLHE